MRKHAWLCGLVFLAAVPAAAQDFSQWSDPTGDRNFEGLIRVSNGSSTMVVSPSIFALDPLPVNTTAFAATAPLSSGPEASAIATSGTAEMLAPLSVASPRARPADGDWGDLKNWFGVEFTVMLFRESFGTGVAETFPQYGFDLAYVRWLNAWFGLEGNFAAGWGTAFSSIDTRLLLYMAGLRLAANRGGRLVPWVHFLGGGANAHASQTGFGFSDSESSAAFRFGGGLNLNLTAHLAWKLVYVGYLYTSFATSVQHNIIVGTGLYLNW
ncbi:MAG: porin family protein [Acidobacteria bacterium]|nr:porin family protein [Acidobacteriota bacterium]